VLLFAVVASADLQAQSPFERLTIVSGDYSDLPPQTAANGPEFGFSVAIDGEWMAVGAPGVIANGGEPGSRRGAVFMFRNEGDGWELKRRLISSISLTVGPDARCGHSVALSGPNLVVGCPGVGTEAAPSSENGRILFFRRNADDVWQSGVGFTGGSGMRCGTSVDIVSNPLSSTTPVLAVTGCPGFDSGAGMVRTYEFDGNDWSFGTVISASDGANGDSFGSSVAITIACDFIPPTGIQCLPLLAVGAPNKQHGSAILGGAAYVYAGNDFNETDIFTHESPSSFGATFFGASVDINGSQLLVGSRGAFTVDCPNAPRCGRVYRWERDGSSWNPQVGGGAINAGGAPAGEQGGMRFGHAVALGFDNWIAIAAPLTDGGENSFGNPVDELGHIELRRASDGDWGTNWTDTRDEFRPDSLSLPFNYTGSQFGQSVAFGGGRWLAVGMPRSPALPFPGVPRGSVWLYAEPDGIFSDRFEQ
jgi:hypothetical protein